MGTLYISATPFTLQTYTVLFYSSTVHYSHVRVQDVKRKLKRLFRVILFYTWDRFLYARRETLMATTVTIFATLKNALYVIG